MFENNIFAFVKDLAHALGDGFEIVDWDGVPNPDYNIDYNDGAFDTDIWVEVEAIDYRNQTVPNDIVDKIELTASKISYNHEGMSFEEMGWEREANGRIVIYGQLPSTEQLLDEREAEATQVA